MTRPSWVNDELFPFRSRFLDVRGARVHYIDKGEGPVFLGLHGNPTWSFLYRHIVAGLKDRFRCVALDYPGRRSGRDHRRDHRLVAHDQAGRLTGVPSCATLSRAMPAAMAIMVNTPRGQKM